MDKTIEQLKAEGFPQWFVDAEKINYSAEMKNGVVVWYGGEWRGGVWHDGVWHGGEWRGDVWHDGVWHDGEWRCGVWHDGVWHGGVWLRGEWHGGAWLRGEWHGGVWLRGEWHGGVWHDGEWRGGVWHGGEWLRGVQGFRTKWSVLLLQNGNIKIGCKEMSIQEWVTWFDGTEEFSTPRSSREFLLIKKTFYAMKAYAETQ